MEAELVTSVCLDVCLPSSWPAVQRRFEMSCVQEGHAELAVLSEHRGQRESASAMTYFCVEGTCSTVMDSSVACHDCSHSRRVRTLQAMHHNSRQGRRHPSKLMAQAVVNGLQRCKTICLKGNSSTTCLKGRNMVEHLQC